MMENNVKSWVAPSIEELSVAETQYGGTSTTKFDYVYQNAEGNWEGTFVAS